MRYPTLWYVRPANAQTRLHILAYFINNELLTQHHLEFLSLKETAQAYLSLFITKRYIEFWQKAEI